MASSSGTMLEEAFVINGDQCTATLTAETLKWAPLNGKNEEERVIHIKELLSTTVTAETTGDPDESVLQLVFMEHQDNQVLRRSTVAMVAKADICTTWSCRLEECIGAVSGRPKNILVVINPASGDKKGPELYREKVAPVFQEASIKTHVIFSESVNHVRELIGGYDLTSIDSITTVGGDGIYHVVADALLRRQMKEADLDLNDPETDVPETCMPIGIIPCGSGNVLAFQLFGTADVESIALGIVRGGRQKLVMQGVWSGGELLTFAFVFVGIGVVADWMNDAQNTRDMGVDRYTSLVAKYASKESVRLIGVSIETRPPLDTVNAVKDANRSDATTHTSVRQPWTTSYQGRTPMMSSWISDYMGIKESKDVSHLDFTRLYVMTEWDRSLYGTHMLQLGSFDTAALHTDNIQHIPCTEYNVTIHNPEDQDWRANMVDIDGEIYFTKEPNFHVKLFPGRINMFASAPLDFVINHSPSML